MPQMAMRDDFFIEFSFPLPRLAPGGGGEPEYFPHFTPKGAKMQGKTADNPGLREKKLDSFAKIWYNAG